MNEYSKINTIWKRDAKGKIIPGDYATPEFEYLREARWCFTEKVDGTNIRVNWDGGASQYGGKTDGALIHNGIVQHLRDKLTDTNLASAFGHDPATLYGEGFGAKIQKGGGLYKPDGQAFVLFDVLVGGYWLRREAVEDVAKNLAVPVVPVVMWGTLAEAEAHVIAGFDSHWGPFPAEGLVGKPAVELRNRSGERVIVKMKTRDYVARAKESGPAAQAAL